jgi:hypothetical protein
MALRAFWPFALASCPMKKVGAGQSICFWSNNPVGNLLYETLESLVQVGVLESRDEPDKQYRWNPAFRGSDR